ncbi:hypothetical protein Golax_014920 [Gossypium laxum]|uniref:RNase H type-1 domain-containing protein n=1 Tax=Gossypium laxum TaxID=34288 RepID=A0A7J8ZXM5_9ROSI|nr:hypothetical protein [Gossypium laxum]
MDVPNPMPFSLAACSATGSSMKWEKPPNDFVKVKVDVAYRNNTMSYGIIIHDCDGLIIVGQAGVKDVQMKLEWAELYALSEEVLIARDLNPGNVIFETYCANMVNHLRKFQDDIIILGFHAKEIDVIFYVLAWIILVVSIILKILDSS